MLFFRVFVFQLWRRTWWPIHFPESRSQRLKLLRRAMSFAGGVRDGGGGDRGASRFVEVSWQYFGDDSVQTVEVMLRSDQIHSLWNRENLHRSIVFFLSFCYFAIKCDWVARLRCCLVAVKESTREETRSRGMRMVIRLWGMSIIQLLLMHLVFSISIFFFFCDFVVN